MSKLKEPQPSPAPLAPRICNCGCGNSFQPGRKDQIYLNKQHADFSYHHTIRKARNENQAVSESHLRQNDRICRKYFESSQDNEAIFFLESLKADGLNLSFFLGSSTLNDLRYYHIYNYMLHLFEENGIKKVKIRNQK